MSRIRTITASATATALLAAGGLGIAQSATAAKSTARTTSTSTTQVPGQRGGKGPRAMSATTLAAIAKTLGITSAQLQAALDANKPAAPSGPKGDKGAGFAADIATALGVSQSSVQTILDANRPAKPAAGTPRPARGTKPDDSKLAAALASGLNLDEATVTAALTKLHAAHDAAHDADHDAMFAGIAKSLGLETAAVKAAFDANRPAKPAAPATTTAK